MKMPLSRTRLLIPALITLLALLAAYRRFPLTTLVYVCIFLHAVVLMTGGAYTCARVPLGFQLADLIHLSRNPYDRIGQGADEFLGTQRAPWDTLSDMFIAVIGAVTALLLFSRLHDRKIEDPGGIDASEASKGNKILLATGSSRD